ncbi:hypothetical protein DNR33_26745 [Escherichia coli]|nr:hypothetical protein [Escherichia coli]QKI38503.1 hypothetical protein FVA71_04580 [Escherichia coli]
MAPVLSVHRKIGNIKQYNGNKEFEIKREWCTEGQTFRHYRPVSSEGDSYLSGLSIPLDSITDWRNT